MVQKLPPVPAHQARVFGIDGTAVLIKNVNGPAAAAGLLRGDMLTHINDQRMFTYSQAMNLVTSSQPGETIRIRVVRADGSVFTTEAVLEERRLLQQGG